MTTTASQASLLVRVYVLPIETLYFSSIFKMDHLSPVSLKFIFSLQFNLQPIIKMSIVQKSRKRFWKNRKHSASKTVF